MSAIDIGHDTNARAVAQEGNLLRLCEALNEIRYEHPVRPPADIRYWWRLMDDLVDTCKSYAAEFPDRSPTYLPAVMHWLNPDTRMVIADALGVQ